jgi:hypothetical protein
VPRYRIVFSGPVSSGIVRWLQALIPVLRDMPADVEVVVEIRKRENADG